MERKKAYEMSKFRQYFILNKLTDSLYGPYKTDSFFLIRKKLKVPDSLKIL